MHWPDWPADAASVRVRVAAGATGVSQARQAFEALVQAHPVAPRVAYRVETVLEELLMNVALHGHADGELHEVDVAIALAPNAVLLELQDDGQAFDPTRVQAPARASPADEASIGGRGLGMVRRAVSEWRYAHADGLNHQRLAVTRD